MKYEEFELNVIQWGMDRGIIQNGSAQAQLLKTMEELGELAGNVARGKDIKDDLGDIMVTLILAAEIYGNTTMQDGWTHAWNEIKDRKGYLSDSGIFIKEELPVSGSQEESDLMMKAAAKNMGMDFEFK